MTIEAIHRAILYTDVKIKFNHGSILFSKQHQIFEMDNPTHFVCRSAKKCNIFYFHMAFNTNGSSDMYNNSYNSDL